MNLENYILGVITTFIQSFVVGLIVFKQLPKINMKNKIFFVLLMWLYCTLVFFFIPNQFRFLLFVIVISIMMYFILKINDKKVILYAFITEMLFSISEIIISLIMVLMGINPVDIINNVTINIITSIFISFLALSLIFIPFIKNILNKINELFKKNKSLTVYLIIFLVILYMIVLKNGLEFLLKSNYYINILVIIGIAIIIIIIVKTETKSEQLLEMNNQMVNHVTRYEKIITEQGKANHEFKNQLMVIRGYAQMSKCQKLIDYVDSIIDDSKRIKNSYMISQLNKLPVGGIKGLLYYKLSIMEDEKIKYNITIDNGVKTKLNALGVNMYKDITKVLGVIIDNAIDASKKSKEKSIIISVSKERGIVVFTISNSYKGKIELDKIGTGYTTKGTGHGFGLRLVEDIVTINKNLETTNEVDHDNKYYITKLIIKTQTKKKK